MANWIRLQPVWKPSLKTALPDCSCTSHCNHASILNTSPDLDPPVYRWGWGVQNVGEEWSMTMRKMFNFSVQAFQIKWKQPHGVGTESQDKAKPFSSYPVHRSKCNNIVHRTEIAVFSHRAAETHALLWLIKCLLSIFTPLTLQKMGWSFTV